MRGRLVGRMSGRDQRRESQRRFGAHFITNLTRDRLHVGWLQNVLFAQKPREHKPVAKRIDTSRNSTAPRVNQVEARRLETRIILPSDMVQSMLDIGLRLGPVKRTQMIGRDHALPQLL